MIQDEVDSVYEAWRALELGLPSTAQNILRKLLDKQDPYMVESFKERQKDIAFQRLTEQGG